jgi:RimJ/RimL family protein N-acetyltransferase
MMRLVPYPYSETMAAQWIGTHASERASGTAFRFGIRGDGRLIGLSDVDQIAGGTGELGYWLAEPAWGKGYATEAATAVVTFAFSQLGLTQLLSGHASDNQASGRVLRKLGFRHVGEHATWSTPRNSEIIQRRYALSRDEWMNA